MKWESQPPTLAPPASKRTEQKRRNRILKSERVSLGHASGSWPGQRVQVWARHSFHSPPALQRKEPRYPHSRASSLERS